MEFEFEFELLKEGAGRFQVESVESAFSKNTGNPMLMLKIRLFDIDNNSTLITQYLTKTMLFQGRALLRAGGMNIPHGSNKIKVKVLDFEGKQGKCIIGIEKGKGSYSDRNTIAEYLEPDPNDTQPSPPPGRSPEEAAWFPPEN